MLDTKHIQVRGGGRDNSHAPGGGQEHDDYRAEPGHRLAAEKERVRLCAAALAGPNFWHQGWRRGRWVLAGNFFEHIY